MDNILEVKNLNVQFDIRKGFFSKTEHHHVIKDVSFDIKKGEILGLVGESGSGKSTIAKSILGLVKYEGEIKQESLRPQMIFQDPFSSLNPSKKVGWLLREAMILDGVKDKEFIKTKSEDMIKRVGLDTEFLLRYPDELSGGQRQRVCIALSLMQEPQLLIADEPVSALDVTIQSQIIALIKDLHKQMDLSMLFISHDLRVVYDVCDRVIILKNGQIVEEGEPSKVYANPQNDYTKQLLNSI